MAAGYNEAMKKSNARYKVYLHQDVMILETAFIENLLHIFRDPKVGMVGMVGARKLSRNGELHETFCVGKVYMAAAGATWCNADVYKRQEFVYIRYLYIRRCMTDTRPPFRRINFQ